MTRLASLAALLAASFTTGTREGGETYTRQKEGTPEWMFDIVRDAHDGMMPNDQSYSLILAVVNDIHDMLSYDPENDLDDVRHERIDSLIPIYNTDRTAWLASHLHRAEYVNEARENMGGRLGHADDIFSLLAYGIEIELGNIWAAVERGLIAQAELADA